MYYYQWRFALISSQLKFEKNILLCLTFGVFTNKTYVTLKMFFLVQRILWQRTSVEFSLLRIDFFVASWFLVLRWFSAETYTLSMQIRLAPFLCFSLLLLSFLLFFLHQAVIAYYSYHLSYTANMMFSLRLETSDFYY